jgi:hypothetical protein
MPVAAGARLMFISVKGIGSMRRSYFFLPVPNPPGFDGISA